MKPAFALCWVTGPTRRDLAEVARRAVAGGVTMVQLRDKTASDADFIATGRALKAALDPLGVPLIVNDRVETVRDIGAAGAHVGQSDMPLAEARARLPEGAILGLSIEAEGQLAAVDWALVDYIGAGPVYATGSKADHAPPIGFDGLARICAGSKKPVLAIGGITARDADPAARAGAAGLAVVSAIAAADDTTLAARTLRDAWEACA